MQFYDVNFWDSRLSAEDLCTNLLPLSQKNYLTKFHENVVKETSINNSCAYPFRWRKYVWRISKSHAPFLVYDDKRTHKSSVRNLTFSLIQDKEAFGLLKT